MQFINNNIQCLHWVVLGICSQYIEILRAGCADSAFSFAHLILQAPMKFSPNPPTSRTTSTRHSFDRCYLWLDMAKDYPRLVVGWMFAPASSFVNSKIHMRFLGRSMKNNPPPLSYLAKISPHHTKLFGAAGTHAE